MKETKVGATRRGVLQSAAAVAALGATGAPAWSQAAMPAGPWSIIIPTAAGGQADVVARLIGNRMSETLGRPLVVEAKAGVLLDGVSPGADSDGASPRAEGAVSEDHGQPAVFPRGVSVTGTKIGRAHV